MVKSLSGFDSIPDELSSHASQLASIAYDLMHPPAPLVAPKGDGVTDDGGAINAILSALPDNVTLNIPAKNYYIATPLKFKQSQKNLRIVGTQGATFISGLGLNSTNSIASQYTLLMDNPLKLVNSMSVTADLPQYSTTVTVSGGLVAAGVQPGDIAYIFTTKTNPNVSGVTLGNFKLITAVTDNQLTIDDGIDGSLAIATDSVTVSVYRPMNNITVEGLTFQLQNNNKQIGLYFSYVNNLVVRNCQFIGGGQNYIGLYAQGFNMRIDKNTCVEFREDSLKWGYGIQLAGHNIVATENTGYRCKHAISAGNNNFISKNLLYTHNFTTDPQLAGFDAHSSCQQVRMLHNTVIELGKSYPSTSGFFIRGRHFDVSHNTVIGFSGSIGSTAGVYVEEDGVIGSIIKDNYIQDAAYGVKGDTLTIGTDFNISDNKIYNTSGGGSIRLNKVSNSIIKGNKLESGATAIDMTGGSNVVIEQNIIKYSISAWGVGIYLDQDTSQTWTHVSVKDNILIPASSNASIPIRVKPNYDNLQIVGNKGDTSIQSISTMVMVSEDTVLTKLIQKDNTLDVLAGSNVTINASASTLTVSGLNQFNTSYSVNVSPAWNTTYWITNKTSTGFTINFGTAPASPSTLDWSISR